MAALKNGTVVMVYKASNPPYPGKQNQVCFGVAAAERWNQPFRRLRSDPILPCPPDTFNAEDPSLSYDEQTGLFHLIFKDCNGFYTHHGYSGAHAISADGVTWTVAAPALAYETTHVWSDGVVRKQVQQERPELLFNADGVPTHAYFATNGPDPLGGNHTFNMVVPIDP